MKLISMHCGVRFGRSSCMATNRVECIKSCGHKSNHSRKLAAKQQKDTPFQIQEGGIWPGIMRSITTYNLFPLDGSGSAVTPFQLHPVFGTATERVPPNDATSRFVGFGDKSWDNFKNFFETQRVEFSFLSQRAQRAAFGGSISPKTPVLKLNRPFACKRPAAIASESTRAAFMLVEKPQVAALRRPRVK